MGEALDALTADWDGTLQEAEAGGEPHLVEINGVWVVVGGEMPDPKEAERDFVADMREERDRSFYIH